MEGANKPPIKSNSSLAKTKIINMKLKSQNKTSMNCHKLLSKISRKMITIRQINILNSWFLWFNWLKNNLTSFTPLELFSISQNKIKKKPFKRYCKTSKTQYKRSTLHLRTDKFYWRKSNQLCKPYWITKIWATKNSVQLYTKFAIFSS